MLRQGRGADRIRVKSPALKRAPQRVAEVERQLQECDGITEVTTNLITGGILVQYDPSGYPRSMS